jgi:hypothetical protein
MSYHSLEHPVLTLTYMVWPTAPLAMSPNPELIPIQTFSGLLFVQLTTLHKLDTQALDQVLHLGA